MAIKYTIQGLLIYAAMAAYLAAFAGSLSGLPKLAGRLYIAGFAIAFVAFVYRWCHVQHVPLQNLFEVFLAMGVLVYPLSVFCRRLLQVRAEAADMLISAIVLLPAGLIFNAQPKTLPPALQSWLFAPHVATYILSYVLMAKAAVQAVGQLSCHGTSENTLAASFEQGTYRMICFGFPLLTAGLILGSCWAKLAWGRFWGWDPKEMWSLACWLVYAGYLHFRYMYGKRYSRVNSLWAVVGMAVIIITLLWANLSRLFAGLHTYAV